MREQRELAGEILARAKPPVNEDAVYAGAAVEGWKNKKLFRKEFPLSQKNRRQGMGKRFRELPAASVRSALTMEGNLPSPRFLKQEDIDFDPFTKTRTGTFMAD